MAQLAGVVISVVCLTGVIWWAVRQPAPELPTRWPDLAAVLLAVAIYAVATVLRAIRWHRLLINEGATPGFGDTLALTVVGYMGNNVLPARAGDVLRVVLIAPRARTGRRTVVGSLLAERLLDIAVLLVIFAVLAPTLVGAGLPTGSVVAILAGGAVAGMLLVGAAYLVVRARGQRERIIAFLRPILAPVQGLRGGHGGLMLAMTAGIWLLEGGVWGSVGWAVGLDPSPLEAMYLVALASVFSLIPSGPGYAGTQDAAAVIGVRAIGGSSSVAVAYLILVRFVLLVPITLAGFVILAVRYGGLSVLSRCSHSRAVEAGPAVP